MSELNDQWALILGCSSGFGEAAARELADRGMNIAGVHLDGRSEQERIEGIIDDLEESGSKVIFYNKNAAKDDNREEILNELDDRIDDHSLRTVFHSLAFGSIGRFIPSKGSQRDPLGRKEIEMTLDVMANTLVFWTQGVFERDLIGEGSRILAMTSAGGHQVWPNYGAVSAAKGALESHVRQLAAELGEYDISVNALQAGICNTPSLQKIPGFQYQIDQTADANPKKRITKTEDIAQMVAVMSQPETEFVTGEIIRVDGGEDIV